MNYNKQFESYIVNKNNEPRRLRIDLSNILTTTPLPKLLPKPNVHHGITKQFSNIMPSLTPAPFIEEENILKFRKSTIDRRYKLRTQNIKINILAAPPSTSKNKKTIRKDKKPTLGRRNKFKSTKNKAGHKVLKLQNKDKTERNTEKHQKHIPVIEEESAPKSKKTTVGRRKYSRTKVTKVIPEGAVRTKRKYIRSMKYTNKAKALLTKKSKKVKIVTENTVVEKIVTDDQIDSVKDILSLNESLSKQKFPRIKHSNVSYYQVCKIGFAETPKGIVFKCFTTNCKFQSYDECIFKSHLNSFHCNSVTVTSEQYCAFCKELFSSSSVLSELEHINKKHLKYASIKNNMVLPLATVDSMHINVELPSIDIEKNSVDNIELPSEVNNNSSPTESDKSLVQESLLEDQIQSTVIHSINNLQSLESKIGFEIISDDELSSNSSVLTNETKLSAETTVIQELSDISSDEDSVFNDYLEKKESCTFDFNDISSDESIRSYKTVSSKSARIKKILNNPDIIVQKILNENKRKQTLNRKYCSKKSKQTEMPKVVRRSKLPTQVSVQIPTQVPVQVPTQMIVQVPNKSPVQTQFKVTVQSPIEIRPTIVMNKLNIQILQPWIAKRPNFKYEVSCTNMLQKNALFAFYKCMGFTCSYHTSSENLFFCHLRLHQQNHLCDYPDTYLFCSYCPQSFEKIEKLMKHIKEVHQHDKYQCSHCFYRSCEMQSLSVHMKIYHDNQHSKTALHCETIDAPIDVDGMFEKLIENRLKYVAPLRCKVCNISIFLLAEYLQHMHDHVDSSPKLVQDLIHNEIKTLEMLFSMNHYGFFQCLYCLHGTDVQDDMRAHLANKHPSEFSYVCKRQADIQENPVPPESIKSTQLIKLINKNMVLEKFEGDIKELENKDNWCKFNDKFDLTSSLPSTSGIPSQKTKSKFIANQNSGIIITNVYSISSETHLTSL